MSRKKPKAIEKPFFTIQQNLSRALTAEGSAEKAYSPSIPTGPKTTEPKNWVDAEESAILDAFPHLKRYVEFGVKPVLMTHRYRAKAATGELSEEAFSRELHVAEIPRMLIERDAWSDNTITGTPAQAKKLRSSTFCPAELYLLYRRHRETPADDLLKRFSTAEGRNSLLVLADQIDGLTKDLRWAVQLSECFPVFPMPDEMWRSVMTSAGKAGDKPPGDLRWFAVWLREASARLLRGDGNPGTPKRSAFQEEWRAMATQKTGLPLWDVGFAVFRLIAPSSIDSLEAFTLAARRRRNDAKPSTTASRSKKTTRP